MTTTFIAVTYNANNNPTDAPTNPSIEVCPYNPPVRGGHIALTWVPVNCTFPPTDGIVFKADSTATATWPYAQPALQPNGTYHVAYTVTTPERTTYNYNVAIISNGGTPHTRQDPDVTNTPE